MKTYEVRLSRRDDGWDVGVEDVGSIRVDRLTAVERAVRAHLALLAFGDAQTARLRYDYGPSLERELRGVRDSRETAEAAVRTAAERSRTLAGRLAGEGLTGAEVALMLGVSPQRVSQLIRPASTPATPVPPVEVDLVAAERKKAKKDKAATAAKKRAKKPKKSKS